MLVSRSTSRLRGPCLTICWGVASVFLLWLATRAGRAMVDGRTAVGARKAALAKGRRKRAFMLGYLGCCGSARCCGVPMRTEARGQAINALDQVFGAPGR